jgi:hypothetical protein
VADCLFRALLLWLQEVLASAPVAPVTTKLECAKLADGAAALVLVPADAARDNSRGALAGSVPHLNGASWLGYILAAVRACHSVYAMRPHVTARCYW